MSQTNSRNLRACARFSPCVALLIGLAATSVFGADVPIVTDVEFQPLASQVRRVSEALQFVGAPLSEADRRALEEAAKQTDPAKGIRDIQRVLDPYVLAFVHINPE